MRFRTLARFIPVVVCLLICGSALAQVAVERPRGGGINPVLVAYALGALSVLLVLLLLKFFPKEGAAVETPPLSPPLDFHKRLGAHIERPFASGTSEVDVQARSISTLADEFRDALEKIRGLLNSDIDRLMAQTRDLQGLAGNPEQQESVRASIEQTLLVLRRTWPDKQARIEVELRKLEATT
jgi:hypothetical protein